jgi:hypothetical protein
MILGAGPIVIGQVRMRGGRRESSEGKPPTLRSTP